MVFIDIFSIDINGIKRELSIVMIPMETLKVSDCLKYENISVRKIESSFS